MEEDKYLADIREKLILEEWLIQEIDVNQGISSIAEKIEERHSQEKQTVTKVQRKTFRKSKISQKDLIQ